MATPAPTAAARVRTDDVPAAVHRAAARSVVRVLVPLQVALLALGAVEVAGTGEVLPLQLAALAVLMSTVPGTVMATEAVARLRYDGALRRLEKELGDLGRTGGTA